MAVDDFPHASWYPPPAQLVFLIILTVKELKLKKLEINNRTNYFVYINESQWKQALRRSSLTIDDFYNWNSNVIKRACLHACLPKQTRLSIYNQIKKKLLYCIKISPNILTLIQKIKCQKVQATIVSLYRKKVFTWQCKL